MIIINNYAKFRKVYFECFSSREDLEEEFNIKLDKDIIILIAIYEQGSYDGQAFVIFEQHGKFFEINASHCSCYGLEEQWIPEELSVKELRNRFGNGTFYMDCSSPGFRNALELVLSHVEKCQENKGN